VTERFTIRAAGPTDAAALARLAALDSKPVPRGRVLVAEVGGELWAAVALDGRAAVADPFRPSGELALLLAQRARQLEGAAGTRRPSRLRAAVARLGRDPDAPLGDAV
jgi:hypothetical protein